MESLVKLIMNELLSDGIFHNHTQDYSTQMCVTQSVNFWPSELFCFPDYCCLIEELFYLGLTSCSLDGSYVLFFNFFFHLITEWDTSTKFY